MKTLLAAASILIVSAGCAMAQTTPSTADKPAPSGQSNTTDPKQSSPGATGAMQNEAGSVATSPQEVEKQGGGGGVAGKMKGDERKPQ